MRKPHTPRPIWMTGGLTLHRRDTLNQKTSAFGHDGFSHDLVGGLEHFLFSHILGTIIPID